MDQSFTQRGVGLIFKPDFGLTFCKCIKSRENQLIFPDYFVGEHHPISVGYLTELQFAGQVSEIVTAFQHP